MSVHFPEHERQVPLHVPNERSSFIARDLSPVVQRELGDPDEGKNKDRGNFSERPTRAPAKHASQSVHSSEDAQETVQSGGSRGERRFSHCLLICTKVCQ
jgi:hypothetical protein